MLFRSLFATFCAVAIGASAMRASYGVASKAALTSGADPNVLMLTAAACWVVGGLVYAGLREHTFAVNRGAMKLALIAGLVVYAIVNSLMAGLSRGEASIVVPISNLGFLTALLVSVICGWERMSVRKAMAIVAATLAIALLAYQG